MSSHAAVTSASGMALAFGAPILAGYDTIFDQTAASFGDPDFVDVVIHAYRHALGLAAGGAHGRFRNLK